MTVPEGGKLRLRDCPCTHTCATLGWGRVSCCMSKPSEPSCGCCGQIICSADVIPCYRWYSLA